MQRLNKTYNKQITAIKDFNLVIQDQEFIVLVGPSGCGKSTLLRLIAGLEDPTQGDVLMDGKRMNDVSPKNRDIAFVFQNFALYPHMNVYHNMSFGLKSRKFAKDEIDRRIKEAAQMLDLTAYLDRKPTALSGGQQQRVALGRAVVRDPNLFLMDEPLSNLDTKLREQMRTEITKLHQRLHTTTLYVTHDQTEAMTMATRLVVMNQGMIEQVGTPSEVYNRPANVFVGGFMGSPTMNFLTGTLTDQRIQIGPLALPIPENKMASLNQQGYQNKKIIMGIRPENIHEASTFQGTSLDSTIQAKIKTNELLGAETILHTELEEQPLIARLKHPSNGTQEQTILLTIDMTQAHFFDHDTEKRIHLDEE